MRLPALPAGSGAFALLALPAVLFTVAAFATCKVTWWLMLTVDPALSLSGHKQKSGKSAFWQHQKSGVFDNKSPFSG